MQISLNVWALYNKLEEAKLKRREGKMFVYKKKKSVIQKHMYGHTLNLSQ